jgi:acetolactate synthase I/II/III large subunit
VIYAGGGILKARAAEALLELAELTGIPVVTTLMARGAFPDDHPLCLGMPGMHGNYTAVTAMQESDLLIALGSRFDDRVTGKVDGFAPDAKIIHVDIDPAELGKVRRPDVGIVGDCRLVIEELVKALRELGGPEAQPDRSPWRRRSRAGRRSTRSPTSSPSPASCSSPSTCSSSCATTPPRTRSSPRASASTRCGPASTGGSTTPTRG